MAAEPFAIARVDSESHATLSVSGRLTLAEGEALWHALKTELEKPAAAHRVDLSRVELLDGAGAALLLALKEETEASGGRVELTGATDDVAALLKLYGAPGGEPKAPPKRPGFFNQVGLATLEIVGATKGMLAFVGDLTVALASALRAPARIHWADLRRLMERAGADGVPIALLINFLLGLILGIQSALQMQQFGVGIYVADLVGKSVTRELGPLMTAIIVAGRSGAAYAAELGTMKVSEEIDALRTLGFDPLHYLVFPRVIALALVVPLLTLLGDAVGCLGGLLVAVGMLDLTVITYVDRLQSVLTFGDVFGGLAKSAVFAVTIALVACQRGLATRGGAAGVGASTTSAVVMILFSLIVLDAVFTVLFSMVGI